MDKELVECSTCEAHFTIIWENDGEILPAYCPMCGIEMDYREEASD